MKIRDIKLKSKLDMRNHYGYALLTMILLNLVIFGSLTVGLFVGLILTTGAVQCCYKAFYLDVAEHRFTGVDSTYRGFRQFSRALGANIIQLLFYGLVTGAMAILCAIVMASCAAADFPPAGGIVIVVFIVLIGLFVLLLLVVRFKFTFFVMNHRLDETAWGCIRASWRLTQKKVLRLIGFELSFIGWWILVSLTYGLILFYVLPYYNTATANLYLDIAREKGEYLPAAPIADAAPGAAAPSVSE